MPGRQREVRMASDESKRNRILDFSFEKFTSEGITHVTMDDISRGVGIGKGTLYKFFPSKEALLSATIDYITSYIGWNVDRIVKEERLNPAERLSQLIKFVGERLSRIKPSAVEYIERCYPEAYSKIIDARQEIIMKNMCRLLEEGKKTGHFEPDMDAYLVTHMLIGAANRVTDARVLLTLDYSLDNLFESIATTLLRGCLTEEGRTMLFKDKGVL